MDVVCAGDSRTAGTAFGPAQSWPSLLRARLAAAGIPSAGTGLVMVNRGSTTVADTRLTFTGSWDVSAPPFRIATANGAVATLAGDAAGTVAEVYYYSNSPGTFTVSIDGGTATTVTPAGGSAVNVAKYQVTGLANATHTIRVVANMGVYLIGMCLRQTSGVLVHPLAVSGYTTSSWADTGNATVQQLTNFINPAIFGLMIATNDPFSSIPFSTTVANLATILSTNNGARAKFLVVETPHDAHKDAWPPYVSALYDRADTLGLPLLDLNDRYGTPAQGAAAGLLHTDLLHETVAGCVDVARAVAALLSR